MRKINDINEIKIMFDQISSPMRLSLLDLVWKSMQRNKGYANKNKFFPIFNHFYNDYDSSFHEFALIRGIVLKTILIIKDALIKPTKSKGKTSKTMRTEFSGINTYNTEKIIDFKKPYSRNELLKFFNNALIIKI